jgi:hypothetical protein
MGPIEATHLLRGIDELADLQHRRPHRSASARNRGVALAIVEELVQHDGATQTKETQPHAADVDGVRRGLVEDVQVRHGVLAGAEALQHAHVLARTPHGVHGHGEREGARQELRQRREHGDGDAAAQRG